MAEKSSSFWQWLSGVAATVIGAVLIWTLTRPGGIMNPPTPLPQPTDPPPTAPPAPTLDPSLFPSGIYEEKRQLITVEPGQEYIIKIIDIYFRPWGTPEGCAGDVLIMSWIIQVPYPTSGNNLEIKKGSLLMMDEGSIEVIGSGPEGTLSLGICDVIYFTNYSATDTYKIQIRHAPLE
jgi:hypothetical protein